MKILFVDAYFYPERIAFSHLENDIIEGLLAAGHEVHVICPTPTRGITDEEYRRYKHRRQEEHNGVHITRFRAPREKKNPVVRALRYFWCNLREYQIGRRFRDADAVFAVSTPPTQGLLAGRLAKKLKVPLVYSLQDLFPDSLVTTGLTSRSSLLYKIGAWVEKKTYARCHKIIVISQTFRDTLLKKQVPGDKLVKVTNWIDTSAVAPVAREANPLFEEFAIPRDRFCVVYAGNFGASQGTDVILKAAALLKDDTRLQFVIFGGGNEFAQAKEYAEAHALDNVMMHPLLPIERTAEVYSLGDVALITCKKGVGKVAMPSKTWSIMACNTPIIASFDTDSELAAILRQSGAGVCTEPENPQALANAVKAAAGATVSSNGGRQYAVEHASKTACVAAYVKCFEQRKNG